MHEINLIAISGWQGINNDISIISKILQDAGFKVHTHFLSRIRFIRWLQYLQYHSKYFFNNLLKKKCDQGIINIFLHIFPFWLPYAQVNCFIPNQEMLSPASPKFSYLHKFDYVLCKTKHAERIFHKLKHQMKNVRYKVEYISFTSLDKYEPSIKKENTFLHLAGTSPLKGTETVIEAWKKHPEWPNLTIIKKEVSPQTKKKKEEVFPKNMTVINKHLSNKEVIKQQNKNLFHLCISKTEGFGHYINEALGCKSIVVTTNAPPMNELVKKNRGFLVRYYREEPRGLGKKFHVNCKDFENEIKKILKTKKEKRTDLMENARAWYAQNDHFFKKKFVKIIKEMIKNDTRI